MEKIEKKAVLDFLDEKDEWLPSWVYEFVNALPTTIDEWVSVSERLPENENSVLIYTSRDWERDDNVCKGVYSAQHSQWFSSEAHEDEEFNVTHWQPLPQLLPQPPTK